MKSLKEQVEELEITQPQGNPLVYPQSPNTDRYLDIDPEDDPFAKRDDGSDSDEAPSEAGITGREHYEEVSKSKLRKSEQPALGKQYTGAAVSRKTLFDDEGNVQEAEEEEDSEDDEDDISGRPNSESSLSNVTNDEGPSGDSGVEDEADYADMRKEDFADADGDDSDIDSDEAFGSGEEEVFKSKGFRFLGSNQESVAEGIGSAEEGDSDQDGALMWDTEDEEEIESGRDIKIDDEGSDSDGESQELSGNDSESESESNTSPEPWKKPITGRDKLRDLLTNDAAAVASTLSASANADGQKGRAVKQQYQTFDRLLDARIKLQKGLTAVNNISSLNSPDPEVSLAAQSAEAAALKLFSTIESIRHSISEVASPSTSKKRKRLSPPTISIPATILWTRLSTLEAQSLLHRQTILNKWSSKTRSAANISAPRSQLDRPTHRDTSTITSMLDAQLASSIPHAPSLETYDDTPFYQSLLRDLIASRASLSQSQTLNTTPDIPLPSAAPKQHRKGVDTKASKGRKVRYTVHEKLQNFAAEEERGTWTESARREFFASLFGGQGMLNEDQDVDMDGGERVGEEGAEGALRLFRN